MQLILTQSTIRSFRASDAASLTKHIGTPGISRNMSAVPYPYSIRDAEVWIASASGGAPETHFAICRNAEVIGGIGLIGDGDRFPHSAHSAEIGYWLGEEFWGRGIMSETLTALTAWAFTHLGTTRIHAEVYARNPASARVLTKAGYVFEGRQCARYCRDGELIDGLMFAKVRLPCPTV